MPASPAAVRRARSASRPNLLWLGWLACVASLGALWATGAAGQFHDLNTPPPEALQALREAYISAGGHAVYHLLLDGVAAGACVAVGALLLVRHPHERLAVASAFAVTAWGLASGLAVQSFVGGEPWRWPFVVFGWGPWLALLAMSWRMRHGVPSLRERQRLRWTWYGMATGALGAVVVAGGIGHTSWLASDEIDRMMTGHLLSALASLAFPASLALAWLGPKTPDPDTLIGRTLVFGALSTVIVGASVLFVILPAFLYPSLGPVYVLPLVCIWAFAGLQAQRYLQQVVNRLLYGQRDEPMSVLSNLGTRLELGSPETTLTTLVETVSSALKVPAVAILAADTGEVLARTGDAEELEPIALPVWHHGAEVGRLIVSRRARGEALDERDREVLRLIASQVGPSVAAVQLNLALRRSRREILTSREEERRRIRRDLHDGLGPALAAIAMQADTARAVVDQDPATARTLLDAVTKQAEDIVHEVRRLVYDLRPPALDDLGLAGAIERLARQHSSPRLDIEVTAEKLDVHLDAAVEVAAYRVVAEALTNVVRHAEATRCTVRLESGSGANGVELLVSVLDNGRGMSAAAPGGIGLRSMRDRAGEVGGELVIEPRSEGGTRVALRIPIEPSLVRAVAAEAVG